MFSGWATEVTEDIAREIKERASSKGEELSPGLRDFIDWQIDRATATRAGPGYRAQLRACHRDGQGLDP